MLREGIPTKKISYLHRNVSVRMPRNLRIWKRFFVHEVFVLVEPELRRKVEWFWAYYFAIQIRW